MPVAFVVDNFGEAKSNYLIPAPFVNINKTFDKQGDGEILGSRYTFTLTGYLVADRGSPKAIKAAGDGGAVTDVKWLNSPSDSHTPLEHDHWYQALQHKQKAFSNLISKINDGAYLKITAPVEDEGGEPEAGVGDIFTGFEAYVKIDSVDLPCHQPGDPYKSEYTINLSADHILGPNGEPIDNDDWEERTGGWLVSAATENWDIEETDKYAYDRHQLYGRSKSGTLGTDAESYDEADAFKNKGELLSGRKIYLLKRTMSATGKNKFTRNSKGDGLYSDNPFGDDRRHRPAEDGFTQIYANNGRAWQQARGFLYDIVRYGQKFLFGKDDKEYITKDKSSGVTVGGTPTGDVDEGKDDDRKFDDADDVHLFALNLPVFGNTTENKNTYKGFNYKRTQSSDVRGGSFTVTESWMLAPKETVAIESCDFNISEDPATGIVTVTVNGTIEGMLDNADKKGVGGAISDDSGEATREDGYGNPDRRYASAPPETDGTPGKDAVGATARVAPVDEIFKYTGTDGALGGDSTTNSKYENAIMHYDTIIPFMFNTVTHILNDVGEYSQLSVNPIPKSKTLAQQIGTGTITYTISYETKHDNFIPYVRNEVFTVNDTYPGHVSAQHTVLGRKIGPVIQSIGTQTIWQRDVSISVNVDVIQPYLCADSRRQLVSIGKEAECIKTYDRHKSKCEWIENPNFVDVLGSFSKCSDATKKNEDDCLAADGTWTNDATIQFTTDMITSKPGDANAGGDFTGSCSDSNHTIKTDCESADETWTESEDRKDKAATRRIQADSIKLLIDSFDPRTYFATSGLSGAPKRVRKRFTNPPQESWNPKDGAWSYSVSWIYELNDPWAYPTETFVDPNLDEGETQDDKLDEPYPGQII